MSLYILSFADLGGGMSVRTAIVSGMHSGTSPSPGLGVMRSLRAEWPDLGLVGLDYSVASSGLHADLVDECIVLPSWDAIDEATWVDQVTRLIGPEDTVLIPTLDLEVRLLAALVGPHDRVLAPPKTALETVAKPATNVGAALGLRVPRHEIDTSRASVERFLRHAPGGAWVKGQHYEAFRVHNAAEAVVAGAFVEDAWGGAWHLEEHVHGQEGGLAFAARDGVLLDAVLMTKAVLTAEGKTWAGEVADPPEAMRAALDDYVRSCAWTGGGELELISTWSGELYAMELNPRFPAWIHGATLCGANLPAALVAGAARRARGGSGGSFTRVVHEVAVRPDLGLPAFPWGSVRDTAPASKHPSGMRRLSRRDLVPPLGNAPPSPVRSAAVALAPRETAPPALDDLGPPDHAAATPMRVLLPGRFAGRVAALRRAVDGLPNVVLAHSVKTCPHPELLRTAARLGLVAEAITLDELDTAIAHGFAVGDAILNGPAKWWPERDTVECGAFFADSVEELELVRDRLDRGFTLTTNVVGIRVAPVGVDSRFGVRLDDSNAFARVARLLGELCARLRARWGVHFHQAESEIGPRRWARLATTSLATADLLAERLGAPATMVDLGGGWHVDDIASLRSSVDHVVAAGPLGLRDGSAALVLEPGKLLAEPSASILTRVLLVTTRGNRRDAVVDAALGDIPEAAYRWHPVSAFRDGAWRPLPPGRGRLLGRSCMERDVLAVDIDVSAVATGDVLAFGGCGGYDLSMAYAFGRGRGGGAL
jgi:diaminopimelate decarboxylase